MIGKMPSSGRNRRDRTVTIVPMWVLANHPMRSPAMNRKSARARSSNSKQVS